MPYAIETKDITKNFDNIPAVNNVNISIMTGELFGLLGPNGAGKTTLINMLSTVTKPSSGYAKICGLDIVKDASLVRQKIGVVFQDITLDERLTGKENLDLHARLYDLDSKLRKKRIEDVLSLVDLSDKAGSIVKTYSGGMMRRLEIARGFVHKPSVLFLDEPTIGLDPQTRINIWRYIKTLTKEGMTIVLTTHYMEEADHLCDRIAIIDHGKIVALDTPDTLKNMLGGDVISIKLKDITNIDKLQNAYKNNGFTKIVSEKDEMSITVNDADSKVPQILNIAWNDNISIVSVKLHKPTLDDVFLHHTGHAIDKDMTNNNINKGIINDNIKDKKYRDNPRRRRL